MKTREIAKTIENNAQRVIDNIDLQSVQYCSFLISEFRETDITENLQFQLVFRRFQGMNKVGFSDEFIREYFKLLEKYKYKSEPDIETVFTELDRLKNFRGKNSLMFSFVTKFMCTLDDSIPIYNNEVCRVFSITQPNNPDTSALYSLLDYLEVIRDAYNELVDGDLIPKTMKLFDAKFCEFDLPLIKRLDFIFWSCGNLDIFNKQPERNQYQNN